jgi:RNA 3'-terminal phosphate cyclase (ATP)
VSVRSIVLEPPSSDSSLLQLDGSFGEGGGQIVRSALALSMVSRRPISVEKIRAGRPRPGLAAQHLTAVQAAAQVCGATVEGAVPGSRRIVFAPGDVRAGTYSFSVDTAGSTTLVLQTILPALLCAAGPSTLTLEGGTHNPHAPPFDFLARTFVPLVNRAGPTVTLTLERPGFYPAGGGRLRAEVEPCAQLRPIELLERGRIVRRWASAIVANLPRHIAERELDVVRKRLSFRARELHVEVIENARGPGNALMIALESDAVTEVVSGFGAPGVSAETVAGRATRECRRYLDAGVPVGEHLADQLLLPMAIAGAGAFRTLPLTTHSMTHIALIREFLGVQVSIVEESADVRLVRLERCT